MSRLSGREWGKERGGREQTGPEGREGGREIPGGGCASIPSTFRKNRETVGEEKEKAYPQSGKKDTHSTNRPKKKEDREGNGRGEEA